MVVEVVEGVHLPTEEVGVGHLLTAEEGEALVEEEGDRMVEVVEVVEGAEVLGRLA